MKYLILGLILFIAIKGLRSTWHDVSSEVTSARAAITSE